MRNVEVQKVYSPMDRMSHIYSGWTPGVKGRLSSSFEATWYLLPLQAAACDNNTSLRF